MIYKRFLLLSHRELHNYIINTCTDRENFFFSTLGHRSLKQVGNNFRKRIKIK